MNTHHVYTYFWQPQYIFKYIYPHRWGKLERRLVQHKFGKLERKLIKEVTNLIDPRKPAPKQAVEKAKNQPSLQ